VDSGADGLDKLLWDLRVLVVLRFRISVTIDVHGVVPPRHTGILLLLLEVALPDTVQHRFLGSTDPGAADVASVFGM
jgi:hypothetical protein